MLYDKDDTDSAREEDRSVQLARIHRQQLRGAASAAIIPGTAQDVSKKRSLISNGPPRPGKRRVLLPFDEDGTWGAGLTFQDLVVEYLSDDGEVLGRVAARIGGVFEVVLHQQRFSCGPADAIAALEAVLLAEQYPPDYVI